MDTVDLTQAMTAFQQANAGLFSCLHTEAQTSSPVDTLKQTLRAIAIQGPSSLTSLDLLPWQRLPVAERVLALQVLLWGQRAGSLLTCTLLQLQHARDQAQPYDSQQAMDISLQYFFLCALTELPPNYRTIVEDFISLHQEDEDLVGPALMVLPKASQTLGFYSGLQLSDPSHAYEFFRAVVRFNADQPDYLPIALRTLHSLAGSGLLKLAISHIDEISPILDALCTQAVNGELTEQHQHDVLDCVVKKFTQYLRQQSANAMLPSLPEALIAAAADPNILSLELLSPMIKPLLRNGHPNRLLISVVKERLERDQVFSKKRAKAVYQLARNDTDYRSTALRLLKTYNSQPLGKQDSKDIVRYMSHCCKDLEDEIEKAQLLAAREIIDAYEIQHVHSVHDHEFLDFTQYLALVTQRGEGLKPVETATTPIRLEADLSNCASYIKSQLKSAWLAKGVANYNRLRTTNPELLGAYSATFSQLANSAFGKVFADPQVHRVIILYAGSLLLRAFQINLPTTPSPALARVQDFLKSVSITLENMKTELVYPLEQQQLEWLTPFLKSPLVRHIYGLLGIKTRDCSELQGKVFFAPIGNHGVTIFGGIILVSNGYRTEELKARCGLLITMYHEFAHYCRRMPKGIYDVNQLTPTKGQADLEVYVLGTPGDIVNQTRKQAGGEPKHGEGGYQAEVELYGLVPNCLTQQQAQFLVRHENWLLPHQDFQVQLEELAKQDKTSYLQYRSGDDCLYFPRLDHQPFYS